MTTPATGGEYAPGLVALLGELLPADG